MTPKEISQWVEEWHRKYCSKIGQNYEAPFYMIGIYQSIVASLMDQMTPEQVERAVGFIRREPPSVRKVEA